MGAAQAVAAAVRRPERLAAVAALGGGGSFRAGERVKDVAFFVGCGDQDFLLGGARNLRQALQKGGVKKVVYRQYEDVEHLAVVQLALDHVFAFFEENLHRMRALLVDLISNLPTEWQCDCSTAVGPLSPYESGR